MVSISAAAKGVRNGLLATVAPWTKSDDEALLDLILCRSESASISQIAIAMGREPLGVLKRIRDGDVAAMVGFECEPGTEEEVELFGLALSGVPVGMVLRWCVADEERPTCSELEAAMTAQDYRPAMDLVRRLGLWFSSLDQLEALSFLLGESIPRLEAAVAAVLDRFDAPTPVVVAQQLCGVVMAPERPYPWSNGNASSQRHPKTKKIGAKPRAWRPKKASYGRRSKGKRGASASRSPTIMSGTYA